MQIKPQFQFTPTGVAIIIIWGASESSRGPAWIPAPTVAHICSPSFNNLTPSSGLIRHRSLMCCTDVHAGKTPIHVK